jgi:hypothetical protein
VRLEIPYDVRMAQTWGRTDRLAQVGTNAFIAVKLDPQYQRDWTLHLQEPVFDGSGANQTSAFPFGPTTFPFVVVLRYGGAIGVPQECRFMYPAKGLTIGVRGSTVECYIEVLPNSLGSADFARGSIELVDAPPLELDFWGLPQFANLLIVVDPAGGTSSRIRVPSRAVALQLISEFESNIQGTVIGFAPGISTYELWEGSDNATTPWLSIPPMVTDVQFQNTHPLNTWRGAFVWKIRP